MPRGPRHIAYTPFGEQTVFLFFELVAVAGTDWMLTGDIGLVSVLASVAIGSLAAAALAANNHRDMAHDRLIGRHTFAVVYGERASRRFFSVLLLAPFLLLAVTALWAGVPALLLPMLLLPAAWTLLRRFMQCVSGAGYTAVVLQQGVAPLQGRRRGAGRS